MDKTRRILEIYKDVKFPHFISEDEYRNLHSSRLVPLDIKINVNQFQQDLSPFEQYFEQWGEKFVTFPRYGIALVNKDGKFKQKDPVNYPNDEWNELYPDNFFAEFEMTTPTPLFDVLSLMPLKVFENYIYRSNILKWSQGAFFTPHIDTVLPSPYLRLWGTTDASKVNVNFYNPTTDKMEKIESVESGRLYLIDTSVVHDAQCTADTVYQFFICLSPLAKDLIKTKVLY